MPIRIQRRRTKGWRMPESTVYVGRGSKWGNPYVIDRLGPRAAFFVEDSFAWSGCEAGGKAFHRKEWAQQYAVDRFREYVTTSPFRTEEWFAELRAELGGKNLACWCRAGTPCHVDTLLALAND